MKIWHLDMEYAKKINQKHLILSGLITKYPGKYAATKMEEGKYAATKKEDNPSNVDTSDP